MNPVNPLICTPDIDSLVKASERASLCVLAAAALCARNALLAEHRNDLDCLTSDDDDDLGTPAVCLVALQVKDRIDHLMRSLLLYEATLRDHLQAKLYHEMPF